MAFGMDGIIADCDFELGGLFRKQSDLPVVGYGSSRPICTNIRAFLFFFATCPSARNGAI